MGKDAGGHRAAEQEQRPLARSAWEQIVDEHSDRVFRLAFRLTGNRHDAEDLTQEVFVRVFRSLDSFTERGAGSFEGWLHRITTNLFLDQARRKQRLRFDQLSSERAEAMPASVAEPAAAFGERTFDDDVEHALGQLAPDFRVAVVLCDIEGMSYDEIAEILGVKVGTVRSRIHRGRAQLRNALAHRAPAKGRTRYAGPRTGPFPVVQTAANALVPRRIVPAGAAVTLLGHLGRKVSDLLDERLGSAESAAAWAHVDACRDCQRDVETEAWVKRSLSSLSEPSCRRAPDHLRGRLAADALSASYADAATWVRLPGPAEQRRQRWTLAAIGGGAVGAAVLGIVALGAVGTNAPSQERRVPISNVRIAEQVRTMPAAPRTTPGTQASGAPTSTAERTSSTEDGNR